MALILWVPLDVKELILLWKPPSGSPHLVEIGLLGLNKPKSRVFDPGLDLSHHVWASSSSADYLLEERRLLIIVVWPAKDLTYLSESQSRLCPLLEQSRRDPHVPQALRPELKRVLEKPYVLHNVDASDVLEGSLWERSLSLRVREPDEIVRAHFESVRDSQAVIYRYQSPAILLFGRGDTSRHDAQVHACLCIEFSWHAGALNQDVALVAIQVEESQVQYSNFVDLIVREQVTWIVFDRPLALDEALQGTNFEEPCVLERWVLRLALLLP